MWSYTDRATLTHKFAKVVVDKWEKNDRVFFVHWLPYKIKPIVGPPQIKIFLSSLVVTIELAFKKMHILLPNEYGNKSWS